MSVPFPLQSSILTVYTSIASACGVLPECFDPLRIILLFETWSEEEGYFGRGGIHAVFEKGLLVALKRDHTIEAYTADGKGNKDD